MRPIIWSFALAVLTFPAFGQPFSFSEPTPLTDTRYVAYRAPAQLVAAGTAPCLLWTFGTKPRITPVTQVRRVGRPVLDATFADAVWTGSHFVVIGVTSEAKLVRRLAGANGEAIGEPATIFTSAPLEPVHLSFDGARVLLLFGRAPVQAMLLTRDGMPVGAFDDVPVDVSNALDVDVSARSGTFSAAFAGIQDVATATYANGVWTSSLIPVSPSDRRRIAVASSPTATLTIWTNPDGKLETLTTSVDRPETSTVLAETQNAAAVAATWDGRDFVYAYRIGARIHFRTFGARFPFASVDASPDSQIALVAAGGTTYAAWDAAGAGNPVIVRDVRTLKGDAGAFGAAMQRLESSASSAASSLLVWFEDASLYAGVRTADGQWLERHIATSDDRAPLAASDGTGFVVVQTSAPQLNKGWTATLLDTQGRIIAAAPRVPFQPTGVAWAGTAYAVVGVDSENRVVGSLLDPSGTVTAPVVLAPPRTGHSVFSPRVASRDNELLVVWQDHRNFACFPPCSGFESDILGARFTPALQRIDTQSLLLASTEASFPDAVWDGSRYVISWSDYGTIRYRTIGANSRISGISTISGATAEVPRLAVVPGGVAVTADQGRVAFLRDGAESVLTLGRHGTHAVTMSGGRLAYVQGFTRDEMPYHGATRLNIRIGDLVPPAPKPSAPQITVAGFPPDGNTMIVEWAAPPEPVNGYRVEYRVDDGAWNELDVWFNARGTRLVIRPWRADPVRYQFRVRAVNDAGFSVYSAAATVRARKLRAVR